MPNPNPKLTLREDCRASALNLEKMIKRWNRLGCKKLHLPIIQIHGDGRENQLFNVGALGVGLPTVGVWTFTDLHWNVRGCKGVIVHFSPP